ncbi:diaminopimelate epimerase, partial [Chloroflexota bacterium]
MNFTKMQGAGNDFIMIETSDAQRDWSSLAIAMCDRHFGIGADSLILVLPSNKADFQMRIFDADGFEAEACGNGIRCLAKYVFEEGLVNKGVDRISVETVAGIREIKFRKSGGKLIGIQASMGKPEFEAKKVPVKIENEDSAVYIKSMLSYPVSINGTELLLNCVSMGNPHAV